MWGEILADEVGQMVVNVGTHDVLLTTSFWVIWEIWHSKVTGMSTAFCVQHTGIAGSLLSAIFVNLI